MDETSGPHYDSALNYPTSRVVTASQQGTATGVAGGCDRFNGSSDYVSLPDLGSHPVVTVECWSTFDTAPSGPYHGLVSSDPWSSGICHFRCNSNLQVVAAINGGSTLTSAAGALAAGQWFYSGYVAAGTNAGAFRLFLNGDVIATGSATANNNLTGVNLAREFTSGRYFNGRLDEVRISNVARSTNWLWATWRNLASHDTFNSYGPAELIAPDAPQLGSPVLSGGQFQFQVSGAPGVSYTVQASTNLTTWTDLLTTNPAVMPFTWSDSTSNFPALYYRVRMGL